MTLVEYSDSESSDEAVVTTKRRAEEDETLTPPKKLRVGQQTRTESSTQAALPPLPAGFRDLYSVSTRASVHDDPELHGGRKRAIPHVAGNWPTHLYLEWYPGKTEFAALSDAISQAGSLLEGRLDIHSLLSSDLGVQLPLHISLSRPVVLVTEERHSFLELLEKSIRSSNIYPFDIKVQALDWVPNFEKTRWFLVLRTTKPANDALNRLLKLSNRDLAQFRQPPLYERPNPKQQKGKRANDDFSDHFHISIAWSLSEPSAEEKSRVNSLDIGGLQDIVIRFDGLKVKIGNQITNVELPAGLVERGGIAGL